MPFQHTPTPGSRSYELWKRRCKEDTVNFLAFFVSILLVFATGAVAIVFLWLPKRHLSQGYMAQRLPDVLFTWNNTFADGLGIESHTATCTADYWEHASYLFYDCSSSGSLDSLSFSLQSLTPFTSQRYRTRSVTPGIVSYYTSAGYAAEATAASMSRTAADASDRPISGDSTSVTFQSGFASATSAVQPLAVRQVGPTPAPQALHKRQSSRPSLVYDHQGELSAGSVIPAYQTYAPEPTFIPIQTPKITEGLCIFFTIVIVLGWLLSAATLWMVLYNIRVARSKTEPGCTVDDVPRSAFSNVNDRAMMAIRPTNLYPPQEDSDSIHGEPAPPYRERNTDLEALPDPATPPKEEGDASDIVNEPMADNRLPARMSILDAYNLLPSYAIYGWWHVLSILAFSLEVVAWALLASFVSHLVTFFKDGGCIAPDTDETDLMYSLCRRFWGVRPIIWSPLPGAMPTTVMAYASPIVIALIMMLIFFLAHLALFVTLCRKSVLCQRHDVEPLGRDNSGRYVGFTRAGYFCFLETPGNHHPIETHN